MLKTMMLPGWFVLCTTLAYAQKQDTVIISLANSSKIIFTMEDRNDIDILKHYNFQELFMDVLHKLEQNDTTRLQDPPDDAPAEADSSDAEANHYDKDEDDETNWNIHTGSRRWGRTWQSFNFDLGMNNYLENGRFPGDNNALYTVRPWGSWYLAFASVQRSRIGKKLFLEWSLGVNWYNFKFENDKVRLEKTDHGIEFIEDTRDVNFIKSKLSASYLQASLVPVLDFSDNGRKPRFWNHYTDAFRVGLGPYIAYRVSSHTKLVYRDGGKEKDKDRDGFYLNNVRYGARLQLGYRSTDLFFNYDLNELFSEQKGPKLNAFSFGVIF